jgi:hypothetical protein
MSKPSCFVLSVSRASRNVFRPVATMIAFIAMVNAQQPSTSDAVRFLEHSTFGPIYCPSGTSCGASTSATVGHLQSIAFKDFLPNSLD